MAFVTPIEVHAKPAPPGKAIAKGVKSVGKAIGGKSNPVSKLVGLVVKLPKEMLALGKIMKDSAKKVKAIKKKLPTAKTPAQLTALYKEIQGLISNLEKADDKFESNKLVEEVAKGVSVCDQPAVKTFASTPAGSIAGFLCGSIKSTDAKFTGISAFMRSLLNTAMQYEAKAAKKIEKVTGKAPAEDEEETQVEEVTTTG